MITTALLLLVLSFAQTLMVIPPIQFPTIIHTIAIYFGGYLSIWGFIFPLQQIGYIFAFGIVIILPLLIVRSGLFVYGLLRGYSPHL